MTSESSSSEDNSAFLVSAAKRVCFDRKLGGFELWRRIFGSARYVLAPMVHAFLHHKVDQSELAWRMLGRKHGVQLAYTPMLNSRVFLNNAVYRRLNYEVCVRDRPLIGQICGDEPETILKVGRMIEDGVDAIDLNLGCPQTIARKGHYGAYLQDEWELIETIVRKMHVELRVPVTCKIRVFPDVERTVKYARMLEAAGAQMLTVHGRTREQKGSVTGLADWNQIRQVVEAVKIPVIANGNVLSLADVHECLRITGAVGVMSAEGHLYNPAIFEGHHPRVVDMVKEYLELVHLYPTHVSFVRGHLFKLYRACLMEEPYTRFRHSLGVARSIDELRQLSIEINGMLRADEEKEKPPHCLCIPYVRHPKPTPTVLSSTENSKVDDTSMKQSLLEANV